MKSCPTCNRTYPDDSLAFCLVDGSVLSAPYEPEQTQRIPPTRTTSSAATEILGDNASQGRSSPPLQSTIHVPAPQVPPLYAANLRVAESSVVRKSIAPWLLVAAAILLVGIFGVVMLASRFTSNQNSANNRPSPSVASTVTDRRNSACGHTIGSTSYDKWIQTGGETGKLGCPITNEADAPASPQGTTGRWIQFVRGDGSYLIEHRSGQHAGKVFEVGGCMFKLYASQGGTKSWLGFPVNDGHDITSGARQEFEGGYVVWDSKTYVCQAHKY